MLGQAAAGASQLHQLAVREGFQLISELREGMLPQGCASVRLGGWLKMAKLPKSTSQPCTVSRGVPVASVIWRLWASSWRHWSG